MNLESSSDDDDESDEEPEPQVNGEASDSDSSEVPPLQKNGQLVGPASSSSDEDSDEPAAKPI